MLGAPCNEDEITRLRRTAALSLSYVPGRERDETLLRLVREFCERNAVDVFEEPWGAGSLANPREYAFGRAIGPDDRPLLSIAWDLQKVMVLTHRMSRQHTSIAFSRHMAWPTTPDADWLSSLVAASLRRQPEIPYIDALLALDPERLKHAKLLARSIQGPTFREIATAWSQIDSLRPLADALELHDT